MTYLGTMNANYKIIRIVRINERYFVLGVNEKAPAPYVTWEYGEAFGYYQGHYMTDKTDAVIDLYNRAKLHLGAIAEIAELATRLEEGR